MKNLVFTLLACLTVLAPSSAQVNLLGRGKIPGTTVHDVSMGIRKMDNLKAPVTSITNTLSGYTLTYSGPSGLFMPGSCSPSSTTGDMVLIIQMKAASSALVGNHQNGIVTGVSGNTLTVCAVSGTPVTFSTASPQDKVQIIKIPEYTNFTLNSGEVTCDPWDEATGTGGVLCFLVKNTLTINGGVINAAGKGYYPHNVTWGLGGAGVAGATTWVSGGNAAFTQMDIGCQFVTVTPGDDGGAANNTTLAGTANTLSPVNYSPGAPNYHSDAVMGRAGYYPSGYRGGRGAGGGGKGGHGANNSVNMGLAGSDGLPGENGGNAGRGARGGGIIIVKANTINIGSGVNYACFNARGQDGDAGRAGGNGGQGGEGGLGGAEDCSQTPTPPGGDGGKGETGTPANGGDGSNSGSPGMIWVVANAINNPNTGQLNVNAGEAGIGGPGGYRWTDLSIPSRSTVCFNQCPPPGSGGPIPTCQGNCTSYSIIRICDRYKAFCMLADATYDSIHSPGENGIDSGYDFTNSSGLKVVYDLGRNELVGIDSDKICCKEYHYVAPLFCISNQCRTIFRKLAYNVTLQKSITGQVVDLSKTDHLGTCTILPNPPEILFKDAFHNDMFVYYGALEYIEDRSEPSYPRCYLGPCAPVPPDGQGQSGRNGVAPPHGTKEFTVEPMPSNTHSNGIMHDVPPGGMWRTTTGTANALAGNKELKLYPQPATGETRLLLTDDFKERIQFSIYDINGRLLSVRTEAVGENQAMVTIDLSALSAGLYTLKVTNTQNKTSVLKLVVE